VGDRIVHLRVEARVDAERPELCSPKCQLLVSQSNYEDVCAGFSSLLWFSHTDDSGNRFKRCKQCLASEQAEKENRT